MTDRTYQTPPDHEERMDAAREYARWHLGYRQWADLIMDAYMDPAKALADVEREKALP